MAKRTSGHRAAVGVSDHAGWAVLVTVTAASDGTLVDRRRVELVAPGLPVMPYHHDAQGLPAPEAVAVVERVTASASLCSVSVLQRLAEAVPATSAIALRTCPPLPLTVEERLTNTRAKNSADWVMYRQALAHAATSRGWRVHWYDAKTVLDDAALALGRPSIDPLLKKTGAALGPPWQKDHQQAMAAALWAIAQG